MLEIKEQPQIYSVADLNKMIRDAIESRFVQVWVKGELSNFKAHSSGHFYFSLKDASSQVRAVMFRGHNSRLKFKPHDGLEVIIRGKVSVYEPRGEYQITCDMMEPLGAGALQKSFEQLKLKLKAEGLFEADRKKPIPTWPKHIAIVTSPTGAAIQDILNILKRRARGVEITIVPTVVQGEAAIVPLRQAYATAMKLKNVEVIIIGRGGGSIEDMWCFNDEGLARLIATSEIPTISAVGHEIDFTICDFVSDLRAPTPSAAAELVVKSAEESASKVSSLRRMLGLGFAKQLHFFQQRVKLAHSRLVDPQRKLQESMQKNDDQWNRLQIAFSNYMQSQRHALEMLRQRLGKPEKYIDKEKNRIEISWVKLNNLFNRTLTVQRGRLQESMAVLDSLSPLKVVDRGYSITTSNGGVIKSISQVKKDQKIEVQVSDGSIIANVTHLESKKLGV